MDTVTKLKAFQKFGSRPGLERIKELTDLLNRPQEGLDFIHVGGTNGKGSVSAYIYSVLKANGYKVGMFTSPFMEGFRESIVVDDIPISEDEAELFYSQIEEAISNMKARNLDSPTEFEVITAMALMYFKKKAPDFVIMEVGLGGIGDSTNILGFPLLSVITSVSMDHCDVLGDTIEKIAHEKSGIIKEGVPVLSNVTNRDAVKVIARESYEKKAPLIDVTKYKAHVLTSDISGSRFSVKIDGTNYPEMKISMVGEHQVRNAVCALSAVEQLRRKSMISLDREKTVWGLESAALSGRFEIIKRDSDSPVTPLIIMDGAHNPEGMEALEASIRKFYPRKKILTIFSLMKDKRAENIIGRVLNFSHEIIIADILQDKPVDTKGLWALAGKIPKRIVSSREELIKIIKTTEDVDIILITGSLYLIRDIRRYLRELHNSLIK